MPLPLRGLCCTFSTTRCLLRALYRNTEEMRDVDLLWLSIVLIVPEKEYGGFKVRKNKSKIPR